jgi:hypothetical protein
MTAVMSPSSGAIDIVTHPCSTLAISVDIRTPIYAIGDVRRNVVRVGCGGEHESSCAPWGVDGNDRRHAGKLDGAVVSVAGRSSVAERRGEGSVRCDYGGVDKINAAALTPGNVAALSSRRRFRRPRQRPGAAKAIQLIVTGDHLHVGSGRRQPFGPEVERNESIAASWASREFGLSCRSR